MLSFHVQDQSALSPPHCWNSYQSDYAHVALEGYQLSLMTQQYGQGLDSCRVGQKGMTSYPSQNTDQVNHHEMAPHMGSENENLST